MNKWIEKIRASRKTIYSPLEDDCFIPDMELQSILIDKLVGCEMNYVPKTRSKEMKKKVAEILGYPVPRTFKRTQPRFPNQDLDIYSQQSDNIQVWNEPIVPTRRYGIIRLDADNIVTNVRVIRGSVMEDWDPTKTVTIKYQARLDNSKNLARVLSTDEIQGLNQNCMTNLNPLTSCQDEPTIDNIIPIENLGEILKPLIGLTFPYGKRTDDRNRGFVLHNHISKLLCYEFGKDNGQFPDIPNQILEVKLQTAPTIDLGLHQPNSGEIINSNWKNPFTYKMARYLVISAKVIGATFEIQSYHLCTGDAFFKHFTRFEGRISNGKQQIRIPSNLFD